MGGRGRTGGLFYVRRIDNEGGFDFDRREGGRGGRKIRFQVKKKRISTQRRSAADWCRGISGRSKGGRVLWWVERAGDRPGGDFKGSGGNLNTKPKEKRTRVGSRNGHKIRKKKRKRKTEKHHYHPQDTITGGCANFRQGGGR